MMKWVPLSKTSSQTLSIENIPKNFSTKGMTGETPVPRYCCVPPDFQLRLVRTCRRGALRISPKLNSGNVPMDLEADAATFWVRAIKRVIATIPTK
jgi:hypothetical protein